jgi:hypothetical protein
MRRIRLSILALFLAAPVFGQGLTLAMKETGPAGQTAPTMQIDATHARLDIPSVASQVLYDAPTKTLRVVIPLFRSYREYTPTTLRESKAAEAGRGQTALAKILYKRAGTSKVKDWPCTTYEGFRGTEKVVEVCAAEGKAIGLTAADFTLAQQAIDMTKGVAPPEMIERIPIYGTAQSQGFAGFPVRRVIFRNGQPEVTTELVDIRREAISASAFTVPADFNKAP